MQYRIAPTTCLFFFHFLSTRRICRYQMSKQKSWVNGQIPKEYTEVMMQWSDTKGVNRRHDSMARYIMKRKWFVFLRLVYYMLPVFLDCPFIMALWYSLTFISTVIVYHITNINNNIKKTTMTSHLQTFNNGQKKIHEIAKRWFTKHFFLIKTTVEQRTLLKPN